MALSTQSSHPDRGRTSRRKSPWWVRGARRLRRFLRRLLLFLGPFVLTGLLWFLLYAAIGPSYANQAAQAALLSFVFFGTTVVFGQAAFPELHLGTWDLAIIVMYVNAASAFFYAYNLHLLERIPKVGRLLAETREDAARLLRRRPWIRRLSMLGVGLFVVSPLPGSGSLGGNVVGRIVGLSRRTAFLTVSIAGVVVCAGYALLAGKLAPTLAEVPLWCRILGAVAVFAVVFLFVRWVRRHERDPAPAAAPGGDPHPRPKRTPTPS